MKKLLSLILCLVLCLSLFACNSEEVQTSEKTKSTQQTENTKYTQQTQDNVTDTSSIKENLFLSIIDISNIKGVCVRDNNSKIVEYASATNDTDIRTLFKYLNSLKLKQRNVEEISATDVSFLFEYYDGRTFGILANESQIGIFDSDTENITACYDIVFDDKTNDPIAFFEEIYLRYQQIEDAQRKIALEVIEERIVIPSKELKYVKIEDDSFYPNINETPRVHEDKDKINSIKAFVEKLELNDIVDMSKLPLTGARICTVELRFVDDTYVKFSLLTNEENKRNCVLYINNSNCYNISDQSEALMELLGFSQ